MIKPLFNKCLIEVIDDNANLFKGDMEQNLQKGILINYMLVRDHLTTSTGYELTMLDDYSNLLSSLRDKVVYWEQYADSGAVLEKDGKKYALVPFYRLIASEVEE